MASAKRNTNESFESYRERLNDQSKVDKIRAKGIMVWDSRKGTYERAIHGKIGGR
jgi:hypothetical protein